MSPEPNHPELGDSSQPTIRVAHNEARWDLADVIDKDQGRDCREVRNRAAATVVRLPGDGRVNAADPPQSVELLANAILKVVHGREVRSSHFHQVLADEAEVSLLMAHDTERVTMKGDGPTANGVLPVEGVTEDDHHGAVGRGGDPQERAG